MIFDEYANRALLQLRSVRPMYAEEPEEPVATGGDPGRNRLNSATITESLLRTRIAHNLRSGISFRTSRMFGAEGLSPLLPA